MNVLLVNELRFELQYDDSPPFSKYAMCAYTYLLNDNLKINSALLYECTKQCAVLVYMTALYTYQIVGPALCYQLQHYIASMYCK